jgi:hypothetical protein
MIGLGALAVCLAYLAYRSHQFGPLLPVALFVLALILLGVLTVEVGDEFVEVRFGPGVIKKKWRLADVLSCQRVRNHWWYGWGIHWIGRNKWLFNVSGLDAVELSMKDGKTYRVGTDEPEKLCQLIQGKLTQNHSSK